MADTEKVTVSVEVREGYHLVALAIASAVPLMTGIITSLRMRRLDWAAAISSASLAVSTGIARLLGLGETAVKLRGAVALAVLGITLLVIATLPGQCLASVTRAAARYARTHRAPARARPPERQRRRHAGSRR